MSIKVGDVVEGKISGVTNFGAFLSFDDKTGLIHISEVSNQYVKDIKEHLKVGDVVKAMITGVENGKISLSIKKTLEPQGESSNGRYSKGGRSAGGFQPKPQQPKEMTFDDMLNKFKTDSEEKMASLKHSFESKRGSSYKR